MTLKHPLGWWATTLTAVIATISVAATALALWNIHVSGGILAYYGL